jgi:cation transport protein ChaC
MPPDRSKVRPEPRRETPTQVRRLRDERRVEVPRAEDFWVFGYGSLMWNPGFPHLEVRLARLFGFHRRFCIYSHRYRGTPEVPGLVFGLDRGGSCRGLAFRV